MMPGADDKRVERNSKTEKGAFQLLENCPLVFFIPDISDSIEPEH
jgi:hypothetical protein